MFAFRLVSLCILFLAGFSTAYADTKTLTADASYIMGDGETPDFAEARALQKAKQTALEEAGTYVQSYTKVQNLDLTTEEIQTVAGGVLQVEVLQKTRTLVGDGLRFYTKIKATVTTDKMEELARRIKGKNVAQEYAQLQAEYARLSHEVESWKERAGKTPQGRERDAALDQIREREKAFARVQQREGEFFQRLVSGKQLVESASRDKETIDRLVERILADGYSVAVGEVKAVAVSGKPAKFLLNVPLTIRISPALYEPVSQTAKMLGGTVRSNVDVQFSFLSKLEDDLGHRPLRIGAGTPDHVTVTLVRLSKYRETAEYFQEGVMKHALTVEFLFGSDINSSHCILGPRLPYGMDWFPLRRIFPVYEVAPSDSPLSPTPGELIDNGEFDVNRAFLDSTCEKNSTGARVTKAETRMCKEAQALHRKKARRDIPHRHGYVAIVRDEATFVVQVMTDAQSLTNLSGVRARVVEAGVEDIVIHSAAGEEHPVHRCAVVQ